MLFHKQKDRIIFSLCSLLVRDPAIHVFLCFSCLQQSYVSIALQNLQKVCHTIAVAIHGCIYGNQVQITDYTLCIFWGTAIQQERQTALKQQKRFPIVFPN